MMILLLSVQKRVKFKQDMDRKTLEVNVLHIVGGESMTPGLRKYSSFFRLRFYVQKSHNSLAFLIWHFETLRSFPNSE